MIFEGDFHFMSSLRGRTRDSSWQWFLIGFVLASGCASVVCLGAYAGGIIHLAGQEQGAALPTVLQAITVPPPVTVVTAVTQIVVTGAAPNADSGNATVTSVRVLPTD